METGVKDYAGYQYHIDEAGLKRHPSINVALLRIGSCDLLSIKV